MCSRHGSFVRHVVCLDFVPACGLSFHLLNRAEVLHFDEVHLLIFFSFRDHVLCLRIIGQAISPKDFLLCSKGVMVLHSTFKAVIHFESVFDKV